MNEYTDIICPYCKQQIKQQDEIVICSDCRVAHHKACWNENHGCITEGCNGTMMRIDTAESDSNATLDFGNETTDCICTVCKAAMNSKHVYCLNCGSALPEPSLNTYFSPNSGTYPNNIPTDLPMNNYGSQNFSTLSDPIFTSSVPDGFQPNYASYNASAGTSYNATVDSYNVFNNDYNSTSTYGVIPTSKEVPVFNYNSSNTATYMPSSTDAVPSGLDYTPYASSEPNLCPSCGTPVYSNLDFCQACGKILNFNTAVYTPFPTAVKSDCYPNPSASGYTPYGTSGFPTSTVTSHVAKFCTQCGTPLSPDARFCSNCGKPIS